MTRKTIIIATATMFFGVSATAEAENVTIEPGRVTPSSAGTSAMLTVRNEGTARIGQVRISCALLSASDEPIDETETYVQNVSAGGKAYQRFYFSPHTTTGGKLTCRVVETR